MTDKKTQKQRRVVWVTGGKGGTGKSTFARGVLDTLLAQSIPVAAFDGDPENAQLHRYYQGLGDGVVRTELAERDGGDEMLAAMDEDKPDVILADVAAGGSQVLMRLQNESLFLSSAKELGYDFTVVSVMSPIKDSVNMLREALEITQGHDVQHVAVKNLHFGEADDFELFDASKTKQQFEQAGGVVLSMRDLFSKTYGAIDKGNLPFQMATQKESGLPYGDRARTRQWLTCLAEELRTHGAVFGL